MERLLQLGLHSVYFNTPKTFELFRLWRRRFINWSESAIQKWHSTSKLQAKDIHSYLQIVKGFDSFPSYHNSAKTVGEESRSFSVFISRIHHERFRIELIDTPVHVSVFWFHLSFLCLTNGVILPFVQWSPFSKYVIVMCQFVAIEQPEKSFKRGIQGIKEFSKKSEEI
uniref:Uncharacterized protein n=1 Tax=Daphnia galeata TaxID=27404 RepID=A0A8J2WDL7_9CRUS|nr:unnamed protein product [Daphnia galeata]